MRVEDGNDKEMFIGDDDEVDELINSTLDYGIPVLPLINELITTLPTTGSSPISRYKQHRLKMLIGDINKNRYRIESIFRPLDECRR